MSKKDKLKKEKARQTERKRLEELEEQREREEAKYRQSRAAKKMRRAAKRGYLSGLMIFFTVLMLISFGYSGFFYGGIMIVGQFTGAAEVMPAHTGLMMLIADALMAVGIVLSFAGKYIMQGVFTVGGSGLYLIAAHRVIADIQARLEKYYVEPELQSMDKTYMKYCYPIIIVTVFGAAVMVIALTAYIRKKKRLKREKDNAPVKSIIE